MPGFSGGVGSSVGGAAGDNGGNSGGGFSYSWSNKVGASSSVAGYGSATVVGGWTRQSDSYNRGGGGGTSSGQNSSGGMTQQQKYAQSLKGLSNADLTKGIAMLQGQMKGLNSAQKAMIQGNINQINSEIASRSKPAAAAARPAIKANVAAPAVGQTNAAQQAAEAAAKAQQEAAAQAAAEKERQRTEAQGQETARAQRAALLNEQMRVNQQRALQDVSPYRRQAAQAAVSAIQNELRDLSSASESYMQQWAPDQFKSVEEASKTGMVTMANGTKVAASTQEANAAMGFSDAQHPTVGSVLAQMGIGALKGFLTGGPIGALAGAIVNGGAASGSLPGAADLRGQSPLANGVTGSPNSAGPGQTLANGQVVGNGNGKDVGNGGQAGWRPDQQGQLNPLAPGYDSSGTGATPGGSWTTGPQQSNEQAYNQYMGLLKQREKANSLTTNAGWMGGSGTSLLGRWAATQGGRGGASGTEYSPLATKPASLYG